MKNIIPYFRYIGAAFLLKAFSLNVLTKTIYRKTGNALGKTTHAVVTETDMVRGSWLYNAITKSGIDLNKNLKILELGTGWNHFYGLFLRHFIEAKFVLFDIQDNRSWAATKMRSHELYKKLSNTNFPPLNHVESKTLIESVSTKISKSNNFNDLYSILDIDYVIESDGNLGKFGDSKFDIIFSIDVLEHVW